VLCKAQLASRHLGDALCANLAIIVTGNRLVRCSSSWTAAAIAAVAVRVATLGDTAPFGLLFQAGGCPKLALWHWFPTSGANLMGNFTLLVVQNLKA